MTQPPSSQRPGTSKQQPPPSPQKPPPSMMRNLVLVLTVISLLVWAHTLFNQGQQAEEIPFSVFMTDAREGRIEEVTIKGQNIEGTYQKTGETFHTTGPLADLNLREELETTGVRVNYAPLQQDRYWQALLIEALPLLFLIGFFLFLMRQIQIGGGKAMSFGKSRAKMMVELEPSVTFDDIAGIDEAKEELYEIVDFLKDPHKFTKLGGRMPRGVLLVGSPGTGKTMLAKGVAGEAGVPFFSISGSDFVEMFVGVGASRVRDLFEQAERNSPCIIFIDEIDAVGRQRGAGLGGGHDEREQTLNQLLVEMDGFEDSEGIIVIAASNRADVLDPALLRPGRFDRRVIVPKPDVKGRLGILKVHAKKSPLARGLDLAKIAQGTPGFSGADLANLVNEAALIAARRGVSRLQMTHFELAKDKILMGPERRSMVMSEREKNITSYHEAGHALVGLNIEHNDPIHKVTIIPRGQALGVTITLPEEDRLTLTKDYAEGMIAYAMGGRAAEELIFKHRTTGASDDINKATEIARKMVCQWGMSEVIGPMSLDDRNGKDVFLGRDFSQNQHLSETMNAKIDAEVHKLVSEGYDKALNILTEHKETLETMAQSLLIKETLHSKDLAKILAGEEVVTAKERKAYKERLKSSTKPLKGDGGDQQVAEKSAKPSKPKRPRRKKAATTTAGGPAKAAPSSRKQNPEEKAREITAEITASSAATSTTTSASKSQAACPPEHRGPSPGNKPGAAST